jgi:CheY-like chemotaxis protein
MKIDSTLVAPVEQASYLGGGGLRLAVSNAGSRRTGPLRLLLVDDDEADIYLIRRALAGNPDVGHVMVARDGVEALDLIDRTTFVPDLGIIDLKMPRKDGFALLRDIASRRMGSFPTVVLSSSRSGADSYRSKKRGALEFVTKPNTAEKLKSTLEQIISRFH